MWLSCPNPEIVSVANITKSVGSSVYAADCQQIIMAWHTWLSFKGKREHVLAIGVKCVEGGGAFDIT